MILDFDESFEMPKAKKSKKYNLLKGSERENDYLISKEKLSALDDSYEADDT